MFPTKAHFIDEMKAFSLLEMHKWALFLVKEIVYSCAWFGVACSIKFRNYLNIYIFCTEGSYQEECCLFFLFFNSFKDIRKFTILFNTSSDLRQLEISVFLKGLLRMETCWKNALSR